MPEFALSMCHENGEENIETCEAMASRRKNLNLCQTFFFLREANVARNVLLSKHWTVLTIIFTSYTDNLLLINLSN